MNDKNVEERHCMDWSDITPSDEPICAYDALVKALKVHQGERGLGKTEGESSILSGGSN